MHKQLLKAAGVVGRPFALLVFLMLPAAVQATSTSAEALLDATQVAKLQEAIAAYELLEEKGGWSPVPEGPVLLAGARHPNARALRNRLRATGDYAADVGADPLWFDASLAAALKVFQGRHGLEPTGELDALTRHRLNLPVEQRLAQLRHALSRWGEQAPATGGRRVWVNTPEATVVVIEDRRIVLQMKAIVGSPSRPTPELTSKLSRIVVNPTWTVPRSIAVADVLPRQQQDSTYLTRSRIRVFDGWSADAQELDPADVQWSSLSNDRFPYRLRQDSGPLNALGKYKFDFSNAYDVYLHDTPRRDLLGLSYRTLSSGCVRVAEPARLADWLAADSARESLQRARAVPDDETASVRVPIEARIDIVYISAWVSLDGVINFRPDIYGLVPAPAA